MRISDWSSDVCSSDLSDDVEATAVGERPQDRREYVACPAALRVEIEDPVALREIAKRHFLLRFAVINPCALRQRRHLALQSIIEIGILPHAPLPDVREHPRPIMLFTPEPDLRNFVFFVGLPEHHFLYILT